MTDSFVTQCPHCHTSFRISRAQLGAAHGAVRCGACMRVFNAAQQLLVDQNRAAKPVTPPPAAAPTPTPTPTPTPAKPAVPPAAAQPPRPALAQPAVAATPAAKSGQSPTEKKSVDTLWIHDDLDLDSLDLDEELAKLEEQEMQLSREFLAMDSAPRPGEGAPCDDTEDSRHDESWAESLIKDEPASKPAAVPPPRPRDEPQPEPPATKKTEPTSRPQPLEAPLAEREEPALGDLSSHEDEAGGIGDGDYRVAAEPVAKTARNEPALRNDNLLDLSDDPLQLDWQQPKKPWGRWIGWSLLNLLAASALAGQYVVYHFE